MSVHDKTHGHDQGKKRGNTLATNASSYFKIFKDEIRIL